MLKGFRVPKGHDFLPSVLVERYRQTTLCASRALLANGTRLAIARCRSIDVNWGVRASCAVIEDFALRTDVVVFPLLVEKRNFVDDYYP